MEIFNKLVDNTSVINITRNATCMEFVPVYAHVLTIMSCLSSIIGAGIITFTYVKVTAIQNLSRKLLLALTVADFFTALGNMIGSVRYLHLESGPGACRRIGESDTICVVQSFITTFSSMASFFWTMVIAGHIVAQLTCVSSHTPVARRLWFYHMICWGVPGIITVCAAGLGRLGQDNSVGTGGWCWIRSDLEDNIQITWMIVSGKGWEVLCYLATALLYMFAKLQISIKRRENGRRIFRMDDVHGFRLEDENFLYVPLILYILRFWGTVRFFLALVRHNVNSLHIDKLQKWLLVFQGIGDSWQAFWNFVLFCLLDATVRNYLCRCRPWRSTNENTPILDKQPEIESLVQN